MPEALAGVASVLVLYHLVRRWFGEPAAVLASLGLALTPVAVLMFRYNNPDALLTLLLLLGAWALWSALETAPRRTGWSLGGALVGLAFTTKMLAGVHGRAGLRPGLPVVRSPPAGSPDRPAAVGGGWPSWSRAAGGWPWWSSGRPASRPYVGGSTDNSELNLIFGYNGFGRLLGSGSGGGGGGGGAGPASPGSPGCCACSTTCRAARSPGCSRLALVGLVAGLWWTRPVARAPTSVGPASCSGAGGRCPRRPSSARRQGRLPPVLHGGAGPGGGRAGRRRCGGPVAARTAPPLVGPRPSGWPSPAPRVWASVLLGRTPGYDRGCRPSSWSSGCWLPRCCWPICSACVSGYWPSSARWAGSPPPWPDRPPTPSPRWPTPPTGPWPVPGPR